VASPSPNPTRYGILVSDFLVEGGATYTIRLVRNEGGIQASATAAKRSHPTGILVQMPSISASDSRVYFLDGDASLKSLRPDGSTAVVTTLPVDANSAAVFAVSPDDKRIAVAIITYPFPARTRIYVEDVVGGGNHVELFSSSSVLEWPVGWHQGQLVIGVGLNGHPQNAYEGFAYAFAGYHVANATTGARSAAVCADQATFGPPVPAGTVCATVSTYSVAGWTGATRKLPGGDSCGGGVLAPDGSLVADSCEGALRLVTAAGQPKGTPYIARPLGWIDPQHVVVLAESGELSVLDVYLMSEAPVSGKGFFAGDIPGSL
jgi:hypothetical protein